MKNVPKIKLSDITAEKLKHIKDGYKIFDLETQKYYEKVNGTFQEMVEENNTAPELPPETDYSANAVAIDEAVKSGNKLRAANMLMQIKTTKNELISQKDMVNQKINFMFNGTDDQIDIIQSRVSEVTEDAIRKATLEEMKQFFIFDGEEVTLNYDSMLNEKEQFKAYREFLLYLKTVADADSEINKEIGKIDELVSHFEPEMVEKSKDAYVWDEYVYDLFRERLADPTIDDKERTRIARIIEIRESATNIKPIIESLKDELAAGRRASLLYAFRTRFNDTLKKAEKYAVANGFNIYFNMVDDIESIIGLKEWKNIFIYLFARYIKYNAEHLSKVDNAFIAQVMQNLIMLKKGQLKEPAKSQFTAGIKELVDLLSE